MAYPLTPLINGKSYSWADIQLLAGGSPILGITSVNYEQAQEKLNLYGSSNQPISFGNGRKSATASITIYFEELQKLRNASPNKQIVDLGLFSVIVSYIDPLNVPVTHTLRNCRFVNDPVQSNEGDGMMLCNLTILPSHIEYL